MKHYPLSLLVVLAICYLSFFTPPKTSLDEIPNFDKLVHLCMYGGLALVIWFEYLRRHPIIRWRILASIGIAFPIIMSGCIEILQGICTQNRSGDWLDFAANCCGVLLACIFGYCILRPLFGKTGTNPPRP